jgi:PilZ domain-containing protein
LSLKTLAGGGSRGQHKYIVRCTVDVSAQTTEYLKHADDGNFPNWKAPMSQLEHGPEARRWTRHRIDVRLKVSFLADGKDTAAFGRANSLSRGGLGAFIPCTIPVGETVSLELTFPYTSTEAKLHAIIRSCEGFRYGLEFVELNDRVQKMIVESCTGAELH